MYRMTSAMGYDLRRKGAGAIAFSGGNFGTTRGGHRQKQVLTDADTTKNSVLRHLTPFRPSGTDDVLVLRVVNLELVDRGRVLLVQRGTDSRQDVRVGEEGSVGHLLLHAAVVEEHADTVRDDDREADGVEDVCRAEESLVRETDPERFCGRRRRRKYLQEISVFCASAQRP